MNFRVFYLNLMNFVCVSLFSQSPESLVKKPNKTPVKQNGPAGKPSGSAAKTQIKVGKAALFAQLVVLRI